MRNEPSRSSSLRGVAMAAGLVLFCLSVTVIQPAPTLAASPEDILRKTDEIRLPTKDFTMLARVTSNKPKKEPKIGIYEVMSKGRDRSLIKTLAPPVDKDRLLLMREENLWAYLPNISKPLRICLRERLIGEVANADIARANFVGDYDPSEAGTETLEGKKYLILELKAKRETVTYARVKLWVDAKNYQPLKAEFYGVSGRMLKHCTYERYVQLGGRLRPSRIVMNDPIIKGQSSVIEYAKMELKEIPDKYFTDDYMKKLAAK